MAPDAPPPEAEPPARRAPAHEGTAAFLAGTPGGLRDRTGADDLETAFLTLISEPTGSTA
ncbi:hypothetical protein [Actinomadura roseirufa]|uniref:hypothetical protein n=1 Tax=Actinomadura roseirufa TaxID=2094049 RepID=UPI0010417307|nr:hypothetical protein [Actinomadura roseirufa]